MLSRRKGKKDGITAKEFGSGAEIPVQAIRSHLEIILSSKGFVHRERLKLFLRFTVEEAVNGRGEQLNEYLVGVEVFGKGESFDPRTNPIVRVEAHRLRLKLQEYYQEQGAGDPLVLEFPKGSYKPVWRLARVAMDVAPAAMDAPPPPAKPRFRRKWLAAEMAVVAVAAVAVAVIYFQALQRSSHALDKSAAAISFRGRMPSIAVLPFVDLTRDKNQEYLCDGLTEELIAALAGVEGLRVVSRTSVFVFKKKNEDIRRIGQLLNAEAILEGSLRKTGDTLRVTAQLIDVDDGYHIWSQAFDSTSGDIFALRDEIVRAICKRLGVRAGDTQPRRRMTDPKASQLYLMGRYHWNKRTPEGLRKAIEYFEQAIVADPGYSRAYAGLADTFCLLPGYGVAPPFDAMPKARAAAAKALEIDEILAEAHASLGYVKASYEWKWDEAEREFRRAMELRPGYATAHHWYAGFLRAAGRLEQAKAEIERAQALDPLSPVIGTDAGTILRAMRRHDDAIRQYRKVIAFEPNFHTAHLNLGVDYAAKGLYSQAIETFEHVRRLSGAMPNNVAWLGYCYARSGRKNKARDALVELDALARQRYVAPSLVALVYIGFGDKERAFEWLEKGCAQRDSMLSGSLAVEPVFDPLRKDPRFRSLLQRIGLPVR